MSEPVPQLPTLGNNYLTWLTGLTHNFPIDNHPGIEYNSNTVIELDFQGAVPALLTSYLADTHVGNNPGPNDPYIEVTITPGSTSALHLSIPFKLNSVLPTPAVGTTTRNSNILILNNTPVDYDNASPTQNNIILPLLVQPNLIFTFLFLPDGISYSNRTLTFSKNIINLSSFPISLAFIAIDNTVSPNIYFEDDYRIEKIGTPGALEPFELDGNGILVSTVVGQTNTKYLGINYNSNTTAEVKAKLSTLAPSSATFISTLVTSPALGQLNAFGITPGFYINSKFTIDGDLSGVGLREDTLHYIVLNTGVVHEDAIVDTVIPIFPPGFLNKGLITTFDFPNILFSGGLTFDFGTGNLTVPIGALTTSNNPYSLDYTVEYAGLSASGNLFIDILPGPTPIGIEPAPTSNPTVFTTPSTVPVSVNIPISLNDNTIVTMTKVSHSTTGLGPDPFPPGTVATTVTTNIPISTAPLNDGVHTLTYTLEGSRENLPLSTRTNRGLVILSHPPSITVDLSASGVIPFLTPTPGSTITFTDPAYTFDPLTGSITVNTTGLSTGQFNKTFTYNITSGGSASGTLGVNVTGIPLPPPPVPPTPPAFVGANFSMEVCVNTSGDMQKTIVTGAATQRETLFTAFVGLLGNIIRKRGIEDYKDPPTPSDLLVLDTYFNSEALTPTYTFTERLDAFKLFMKTHVPPVDYTPPEAKIIDDTVKVYFKMMRDFILKFYSNSSVVSNDCFSSTTEKPGFTASASDCYSNIKLSM